MSSDLYALDDFKNNEKKLLAFHQSTLQWSHPLFLGDSEMAHNISIVDGKAEMAYAGDRPWHGLGVSVPGLMKTSEALTAAHLDWTVTKEPLQVVNENGFFAVPDHYGILRSDNAAVLGVVGNVYTPISNKDAFAFFDGVLGENHGQIETAAALGQGEKVFMLARLPVVQEVVKGDPMEQYLLVHNSHDGSSNLEVMFTNVRVVCQNTLSMALAGQSNRIKIRHCSNFEERMREAERTLVASKEYWEEIRTVAQHLSETSITRVEVGAFMDVMFPVKEDAKKKTTENSRERFVSLLDGGRGADIPGVKGTAWGMYNAYVEYLQYERSVKGLAKDATNGERNAQRWQRMTLGTFSNDMQKAFDTTLSLAAA